MSALPRHRTLLACAFLLLAPSLFADAPAAVYGARMVYDPQTTYSILFGGTTSVDAGTRLAYDLNETWEWLGNRWIRVYTAHSPSARALYGFVFDTSHNEAYLFGGRVGKDYVNDTWAFDGTDWSQITTATAPSPRGFPGMAYDTDRNVTVLFGGFLLSEDLKTTTNYYDTWEFDGTNWTQVNANGPQLSTPSIVYDQARHQMLLLGVDSSSKTEMYSYDPSAKTWTKITPATLPPCVNSATETYQNLTQTVVLFGGTCTASSATGDTWEWDGTNWTASTTTIDRLSAAAMTYDFYRQETILYGGNNVAGIAEANMESYISKLWIPFGPGPDPLPRSLAPFIPDPIDGGVWMVAGLSNTGILTEFWRYHDGVWDSLTTTDGPVACTSPNSAFDSDRNRLVVVCSDSTLYEFDGTTWTSPTGLKTVPTARRFSSMTYDPSLKKTVMFGGWDDVNSTYLDETWEWDGTSWTRQKNNPAPRRSLASMWYDPTLKKTLIYGGIGQAAKDARIDRFDDMWSFDGTGWTQITPTGSTPGPRYGAEAAVDPRSNKLILFGGLKLVINGTTQSQIYADDMWQWDGTSWTQLTPDTRPTGRENGGLAFDSTSNQMVLFGGYNGRYLGDLWSYSGTTWTLHPPSLPAPPRQPGRWRGSPPQPPPKP